MSDAETMDFNERVQLGRSGLMVSRLGIASGYGVPASSMEKAFHEYHQNYFFISIGRRKHIKNTLGSLLPRYRDEMVLALPYFPMDRGLHMRRSVEHWLREYSIDAVDFIILQGVKKPSPRLFERAMELKEEGKVRFIGISSHDRPFLGRVARGDVDLPVDLLQLRYNLVHRGAEEDIFPHLPAENGPGIVAFTATCWRKPLQARNMPAGETPLTAADCYRFALSHPSVHVCMTGPSNAQHMEENLAVLNDGPVHEAEMLRFKRIGDHIHGKK